MTDNCRMVVPTGLFSWGRKALVRPCCLWARIGSEVSLKCFVKSREEEMTADDGNSDHCISLFTAGCKSRLLDYESGLSSSDVKVT